MESRYFAIYIPARRAAGLSPASVQREEPLDISRISFEFGSFSEQPRVEGTRVRFGSGDVTEFSVGGLESCEAQAAAADSIYKAPQSAMKTVVRCHAENMKVDKAFTVSCTLKYR